MHPRRPFVEQGNMVDTAPDDAIAAKALTTRTGALRARLTGPTARKGILSVLDQGLLMGANFVTSVLMAAYCAKATFGTYVLTISALNLLAQMQRGFVTGPMAIAAPPLKGRELKRYLTGLLLAQMIMGSALSIGVVAAGYTVASLHAENVQLGGALAALGVGVWAMQGKMFCRGLLYSQLRPGRALVADGIGAAVQLGVVLWLLCEGKLGAVTACYAIGAGGLAGLAAGLVFSSGFLSRKLSGIRAALQESWHLGKWMFATAIAIWFVSPVLSWFLKATNDDVAVARWGAALNIANVSGPFLGGFYAMATPRFSAGLARGGVRALRRLVCEGTMVIVLGMVCFFAIVAVFGEDISRLIYRGRYEGIGLLAAMVSGSQLVAVLGAPAAAGLGAVRRVDLTFVSYLVQATLTVTLGWPLCRKWGVVGAVAVMFTAGTIASATRIGLYAKASRWHIFHGVTGE